MCPKDKISCMESAASANQLPNPSFLLTQAIKYCHRSGPLGPHYETVSQIALNVRFGSKADICTAPAHVRFTPNSDRESGPPQTVMSALPPKADMCSAPGHVC